MTATNEEYDGVLLAEVDTIRQAVQNGIDVPSHMLVVENTDEGLHAMAMVEFEFHGEASYDDKKTAMEKSGFVVGKELNRPVECVVFVSEAWYSVIPMPPGSDLAGVRREYDERDKKFQRPSKDPNRREAYIVVLRTADGRSAGCMLPFERNDATQQKRVIEDDVTLTKMDAPRTSFESGLLQAFLTAYEQGSTQPGS